MSAEHTEFDLREQIVRIDRAIAETAKFVAEQHKLMAERDEKTAATIKAYAETAKLKIDRWVAPAIVVFGGLGSLIAGFAAIHRLLS